MSVIAHLLALGALTRLVVARQTDSPPLFALRVPVGILPTGEAGEWGLDAASAGGVRYQAAGLSPAPTRPAPLRAELPMPEPGASPLPGAEVIGLDADAALARIGSWMMLAGAGGAVIFQDHETGGDGATGAGSVTGAGRGGEGGRGGPAYLRNPRPAYPRVALENGWEGTTLLRVEVSPQGRPDRIEVVVSSGYPVLDETAVETVRRWRFVPAREDNTPVTAWVEVPIDFRLVRG